MAHKFGRDNHKCNGNGKQETHLRVHLRSNAVEPSSPVRYHLTRVVALTVDGHLARSGSVIVGRSRETTGADVAAGYERHKVKLPISCV